jgi:hypothetical protein
MKTFIKTVLICLENRIICHEKQNDKKKIKKIKKYRKKGLTYGVVFGIIVKRLTERHTTEMRRKPHGCWTGP